MPRERKLRSADADDAARVRVAVVSALRALAGVADVELEPEPRDPGGLGALRIRLLPGADEVAVARAADRVLRTNFSLAVDAERVQLVEDEAGTRRGRHAAAGELSVGDSDLTDSTDDVDSDDVNQPPSSFASARVSIERLQVATTGLITTVTVRLSRGGVPSAGVAEGTTSSTGVHRAVALATLHALEQVVAAPYRFELEHVDVAVTGTLQTAVVVVTLVTELGGERLSGASVVRGDTRQAVVRATLSAVNRRLEGLSAG